MNTFTRRTLGKRLLFASVLPLLKNPILAQQTTETVVALPDTIAGYALTMEDKKLATKFLSEHEKNMKPLREKDLPNSLAPNFVFASPRAEGKNNPP